MVLRSVYFETILVCCMVGPGGWVVGWGRQSGRGGWGGWGKHAGGSAAGLRGRDVRRNADSGRVAGCAKTAYTN